MGDEEGRSLFQTKLGSLFLKSRTARSGVAELEEILLELTPDRLVVRAKEEGRPTNEGSFIKEERHVCLVKDTNGSVGISLEGGIELKTYATVSVVAVNSPAHCSGQVFKGDVILAVNGRDVTRMTVHEVAHLVATSQRKVNLHLARPCSKDDTWKVTNAALEETAVRQMLEVKDVVLKQDHNGLGMTFKGGCDLKSPLRVDKIINNSPAHRSDQINRDDIILAINDVDTRYKSIREAVDLVQSCGQYVTLQLGYPKEGSAEEANSTVQISGKDELPVLCSVPLTLAYLSRYEKGTDQLKPNAFQVWAGDGGLSIELHGPQSRGGGEVVDEWVTAVRNNIRMLNEREVIRMNEVIGIITRVTLVGWMSERVPVTDHLQTWNRKFLVLRSDSLEIYNSPPETVQDWCQPESVLKLSEFSIKILKGRSQPNLRSQSIYVSSGKGQSHLLSFECDTDLSVWTKALHTANIEYVLETKYRKFKGTWKGKDIVLIIDIDEGVIFQDSVSKTVIFKRPFSVLLESCDDKLSHLKLTFASSQPGQQEVYVVKLAHLQLVVSCIESFLEVKVATMDPNFAFSSGLSLIAV